MFVRRLIKAGADLNRNGDSSPLIIACRTNNEKIVEILIDSGADIDYTDKNGDTALIHMSGSDYPNIVNILLNRGANINFIGYIGETALFNAVRLQKENILDILLNRGANVNIKNIHGETALMVAVINGYANIVNKLITKGADQTITNNHGNTPLKFIERKLKNDNEELLMLNNPKNNSQFMIEEWIKSIEKIIKNDKDIIGILKLDMLLYILHNYNRSNMLKNDIKGFEETGLLEKVSNYYTGIDSGNIHNKKSKRKKSRRKYKRNKSKRKSIRKKSKRNK
jgi:ankyrin repeat protein